MLTKAALLVSQSFALALAKGLSHVQLYYIFIRYFIGVVYLLKIF